MKLFRDKKKYNKYSDVVPDYEIYVKLQKEEFASFEHKSKLWSSGQERCITSFFTDFSRNNKILDIACGDGVGLRVFRKMKFENVVGVEFNKKKALYAKKVGYKVHQLDMHDLSKLGISVFDIVYSSHTLEHAYYPKIVFAQLWNVLKENGTMIIVLPYPDNHSHGTRAHGGRYEMGSNLDDDGKALVKFIEKQGFVLRYKKFDSFRESEIWLTFSKTKKRKLFGLF